MTTSTSTATRDHRVKQRERFIREAYEGSDETMRLAQKHMRDRDLTTFVALRPRLRAAVPGHRREQGARRPRPALAAADRQLPHRRRRRDDRQGQGLLRRRRRCRSTSTSPAATRRRRRRRPVSAGSPAGRRRTEEATRRWRGSRPRSWRSRTPTTGPATASPRAGRSSTASYTKAEARYIPNGAGQHGRHGAPDPHGRRGRLLLPAVPVRRGDARHADRAVGVLRPARLRAGRAGPALEHEHAGDVPRRRRRGSSAAWRDDVRSIDLAPTAAFLLGVPAPQHSQGVVRRDIIDDGDDYTPVNIVGLNDFHGQLDPATTTLDANTRRRRSAAPRSSRRCSTRRRRAARASRCCWRRATTSARRRRARRCWRTCRRSTWRTRGGSTPRASATTSSTSGSTRILKHQARANFPFLATNIVETATGREPAWMKTVRGLPRQRRAGRRDRLGRAQHARAGASPATPRASSSSTRPSGSGASRRSSARAGRAASRSSSSTRAPTAGANAIDGRPAAPWEGPIIGIVDELQDTTVDLVDRRAHAPRGEHGRSAASRWSRASTPAISYSVAQLHGRRRRRALDGRGDAPGQEPRRRPAAPT